jgi:2-polyprenyl-3-methyl-5-hydroxy-6-metoxy-1,4-benzoquinol methylase
MSQAYQGYEEWKGWGREQFQQLDDRQRSYYATEFAGIPLNNVDVLEIGFGSGSLLAWLRQQGAVVHGTEVSTQAKVFATQAGVTVLDERLDDIQAMAGSFGVVAAFDVLEHLTQAEITGLLDKAAVLLRPGGHFIARFPNGASPFGLAIQNGDITHVSTLSATKLSQWLVGRPFTIERLGNSSSATHGGVAMRVGRLVRGVLRAGVERGLRALYGIEGPLHPNLTVVLRRTT